MTGPVPLEQAYRLWNRGRWPNFAPAEMACRCGGRFCEAQLVVMPDFMDALQRLRHRVGPLVINSGHRCSQWNALVGGAANSRHKSLAVDVSLRGHDPMALLEAARDERFTGIGLGRSFLHLDRRTVPAQWEYPGAGYVWGAA